jgi:hypothetical protein
MKSNGQECDGHMNWNAVQMRRREGGKDKKGINERGKKSLLGYTLVTMETMIIIIIMMMIMMMVIMMMIFTVDPQKINLYVLNFTVKNGKTKTSLHWQCVYYSHTFRIVVSPCYVLEYVYEGVERGLRYLSQETVLVARFVDTVTKLISQSREFLDRMRSYLSPKEVCVP